MALLSPQQFKAAMADGSEVLDTRDVEHFKQGFVSGSIGIPLKSKFKEYAELLFDKEQSLLLITELEEEQETVEALSDAGFNNIAGFLSGGFDAWKQTGAPVDMIIDVEPDELIMDIPFDKNLLVLDVRKPIEFAEGHLKDAVNIPLDEMKDPLRIAQIEDSDNLYIHCASGTRSVIAASLLKKHGIHNLRNVVGGWNKIKEEPRAEIVKEPGMLN